ncbi:MAG: VIT1/CCC1 transporter family protein [Clostridiales bacterium]|nr:VIT1/CCC1 transporter family protein [Clostridiales bacterium]
MENKQPDFGSLSAKAQAAVLQSQRDEETGALMYAFIAGREKNEDNAALLLKMSADEQTHAAYWQSISRQKLKPDRMKLYWLKLQSFILGYTFVIKRLINDETGTVDVYERLKAEIPGAAKVQADEIRHEKELAEMLDEERLQYVGAMVLGLNDALVELTGTIAGLSFALQNTRIVALSGIITGISATLSMAASNYLAERADGNENALKSSIYTGVAYLVTVALLVLPYLLLPDTLWALALVLMICVVVLVILAFNYYISVAKTLPFRRRFTEMVAISLGVAIIAFLIGLLAKALLGVDI